MPTKLQVVFFSPNYIMEHSERYPAYFGWREDTNLGGEGNVAPPQWLPACGLFIELVNNNHCLPPPKKYATYCLKKWKQADPVWYKGLTWGRVAEIKNGKSIERPLRQIVGLWRRCQRNFYVGMIDAFYVWALISQLGWYDICFMCAFEDAVSKTDLILEKKDLTVTVAIRAGGKEAERHAEYKKRVRDNGIVPADYTLVLPMERPRGVGNKRWFQVEDLEPLRPENVLRLRNQ